MNENQFKFARQYNARYEIVRTLVKEKTGATNFHFTPGKDFMKTPIYDIVTDLLDIYEDVKVRESNPPKVDGEKQKLG